jgi:hypothetical protein
VNRDVPRRPRDRRLHGPGATALAVAILAGALLAGVTAGCGGGGGSTSTTASSSSTTSSSSTSPSAQTTNSTTTTGTAATSGGNSQPSLTPRTPSAAATTVLTSHDPALVCARTVTQRYLRVAYGGRRGCVDAQAPGSAANAVETPHEVVRAGTAKVVAVASGGPYDGEKITVSLVKENGTWKVDALHAHVPVGP